MKDIKSPKEKARDKRLVQRKERMQDLYKLLGGCHCVLCERDLLPCEAEFHHTNPGKKKFGISRNVLNKRWEVLVEEALKCVILCASCHRIAHRVRSTLFTD